MPTLLSQGILKLNAQISKNPRLNSIMNRNWRDSVLNICFRIHLPFPALPEAPLTHLQRSLVQLLLLKAIGLITLLAETLLTWCCFWCEVSLCMHMLYTHNYIYSHTQLASVVFCDGVSYSIHILIFQISPWWQIWVLAVVTIMKCLPITSGFCLFLYSY